jgi:hypothetical protein
MLEITLSGNMIGGRENTLEESCVRLLRQASQYLLQLSDLTFHIDDPC